MAREKKKYTVQVNNNEIEGTGMTLPDAKALARKLFDQVVDNWYSDKSEYSTRRGAYMLEVYPRGYPDERLFFVELGPDYIVAK